MNTTIPMIVLVLAFLPEIPVRVLLAGEFMQIFMTKLDLVVTKDAIILILLPLILVLLLKLVLSTDHCYHLIYDRIPDLLVGAHIDYNIDYPATTGIFGHCYVPSEYTLPVDYIGPVVAVCGYNYGWDTRVDPPVYSWANPDGTLNKNVTTSAPKGNCPGDVSMYDPPYLPSTRPYSQYIPCTAAADGSAACALGWGNYYEVYGYERNGCILGCFYPYAILNDSDHVIYATGSPK